MTERNMSNEYGGELVREETFERRLEAEAVNALRGIIQMRPDVRDHVSPKFEKKLVTAPNGESREVLYDPRSELLKEFNRADSLNEFSGPLQRVFGGDLAHVLEKAKADVDEYFENFSERMRESDDHLEIVDHIETQIKPKTIEMIVTLTERANDREHEPALVH